MFETVRVDEEIGTIVWENGADIDRDVLIENHVPSRLEKEKQVQKWKPAAVHEPRVPYGSRK